MKYLYTYNTPDTLGLQYISTRSDDCAVRDMLSNYIKDEEELVYLCDDPDELEVWLLDQKEKGYEHHLTNLSEETRIV